MGINITQLVYQNPRIHVFINIVDNRILMFLRETYSKDIEELFEFIKSKEHLIRPTFTTLLDLTSFQPMDDKVLVYMELVQQYFKKMGWGKYARVKKQNDGKSHLVQNMVDGFFLNNSAANNYLNEYRKMEAYN